QEGNLHRGAWLVVQSRVPLPQLCLMDLSGVGRQTEPVCTARGHRLLVPAAQPRGLARPKSIDVDGRCGVWLLPEGPQRPYVRELPSGRSRSEGCHDKKGLTAPERVDRCSLVELPEAKWRLLQVEEQSENVPDATVLGIELLV